MAFKLSGFIDLCDPFAEMAENTSSLAETEHGDTTMNIECKIIEQLKEEMTTSFECLMCCKGFQSVEEFQRHQNEHAITQSETLQVHLFKLPTLSKIFRVCLEHASSLILTCFEHDLGMFLELDLSKNCTPLALACGIYLLSWKANSIKLDFSMFENDFSM